MSIHSSLKSADTMKRHRSVLSRLERVQILKERGSLNLDEESSVFGLPKVKHLKIRVKKEKAAAPAAGTAQTTAGAPAAGAPASPAPASGTKGPQKSASQPKPEAGTAAVKAGRTASPGTAAKKKD